MKKMGVPGKILCVLMLLLHNSIQQQQVFNDIKTLSLPANYKIGWMESLDDNKLISDITIPGTHDSLALYGGFLAKCQAWSLEDQLKAGIRYFDLRVFGAELKIKHGPFDQRTTFPIAFNTIRKFLSEYKSETVLVRVKPGGKSKDKVPNLVAEEIKKVPDCWVSDKIPKIGEVRGKTVFVQKDAFKLGISSHGTDKPNDYIVVSVKNKKEKIISHLKYSADKKNRLNHIVLNYSSGTGIPRLMLHRNPKSLAKNINPWLYEYLNNESKKTNPKPCFGVIAMDFPGLDLIRKVTEFN
ncbi:1-phosphatidylinositol phosphodiesterase-like [Labeo rohita]|uniref:1-phosphatidylinositol phosphodiesterase-like n=1 Tax=Labeo rohita TaxID=84645 RepID=UPI0021E1E934|nr:1-phosphatidylinositol phosphodiesterase-like [Labeo rohita]